MVEYFKIIDDSNIFKLLMVQTF